MPCSPAHLQPLSTPSSGSPEGIRSLDPLDHDFSDLEMLLAAPEADSLGFLDAAGMEELELEALPLPQQAQQEEVLPEPAAHQAAGLAFVVEDYVPKEDSAAGGAQMLITGGRAGEQGAGEDSCLCWLDSRQRCCMTFAVGNARLLLAAVGADAVCAAELCVCLASAVLPVTASALPTLMEFPGILCLQSEALFPIS